MTESEERAYIQGQRAVWLSVMRVAIRELCDDGIDLDPVTMLAEREAAIAALRDVCEDHGDNDWDEDLHLADIIRNHLQKHLEEPVAEMAEEEEAAVAAAWFANVCRRTQREGT